MTPDGVWCKVLCVSISTSGLYRARDLILEDDALSTKPVMLICAPFNPITRLSCSRQSLISVGGCTST